MAPFDARRALSEVLALCAHEACSIHEASALRLLVLALLAPLGGAVAVAFESFPTGDTLAAEMAARLAFAREQGAVGPAYDDAVCAHVDRLAGEAHAATILREPALDADAGRVQS